VTGFPLRASPAMLLFLMACAPEYDGVRWEILSAPPAEITMESSLVEMTAGLAVVVRARPLSSSRTDFDAAAEIVLIPDDEDVFAVLPGPGPRDFALVCVWPGETMIAVQVDGRRHERIQVRCTAYQEDKHLEE